MGQPELNQSAALSAGMPQALAPSPNVLVPRGPDTHQKQLEEDDMAANNSELFTAERYNTEKFNTYNNTQ